MPISINPIFPVIAAQGAAPDVVLQPGTVIDAQVLKILANDLVRIAIANLSIEVLSEIPLQVGQTLQLAVSQTPEGIKLAVVGQGRSNAGVSGSGGRERSIAQYCVAGSGHPCAGSNRQRRSETSSRRSAAEKSADAAAGARGIRGGANRGHAAGKSRAIVCKSGAVAVSDALPAKLQQAVAPLLALRPNLDQNLTGNEVKAAFKSSGLFLESSLASGSVAPSPAAGVPDLKAALIVLRQTLLSLGSLPESASAPAAAAAQQPQRPAQVSPDLSAAGPAPEPHIAASPALAPSLISEIDVEEVFLPQARLPVADDFSESNGTSRIFSAASLPLNADAGTRAATTGAILNLLQEALQAIPQKAGNAAKLVLDEDAPLDPLPSANGPQRAPRNDDAGIGAHHHAAAAVSRCPAVGAACRAAVSHARYAAGSSRAPSA